MNSLPPALIIRILSELPLYSLNTISLVCKEWRKLSQSDTLWQRYYLGRFCINDKYGKIKENNEKDNNSMSWKKMYEVGTNWRRKYHYSSSALRAHSQAVTNITMMPGEAFATASMDSSLRLYQFHQLPLPKNSSINNGTYATPQWGPRLISSVKTDAYGITCATVSCSSSVIVTGGIDGAVQLYSLPLLKFIRTFPNNSSAEILTIGLCAEDQHYRIITSDSDGYIKIWDPRDRAKSAAYPLKSGGPVRSLLCVENLLVVGDSQGTIKIIDCRFNRPESSAPQSITTRRPSVEGRRTSTEGRRPSTEERENPSPSKPSNTKLKHIANLESHTQPIIGLSLSNRTLVSCSLDWSVKIWSFPWLTNSTASEDTQLEIVEEPEESLEEHLRGVWSVKIKDEKIVSGGEDKEVRIWDGSDRECEWWCVNKIKSRSPIRSLDFDDCKILGGGEDGTIRIWDFRTAGGKEEPPEGWTDWALKLF